MREIRSYGSVGVSAGNRRHYPAVTEGTELEFYRRLRHITQMGAATKD